jgi:hypothetical protein
MKNSIDIQHKKRYGQYFSGLEIANKLFSLLPKTECWDKVLDPMVGTGDLLCSVIQNTKNLKNIMGIEIDKNIATICKKRLPNIKIVTADAFECPEILTDEGWDLIITNPPYVRYQLQKNDDGIMPNAKKIRENLIKQIKRIQYLSKQEKELFLQIANNYSGLSDMAIPSWILCASLVKIGGYIAIVVPDTWLNRDYASPIQYLLTKCFHIETIAKNNSSCCFDNALVKTSLVIAKRTPLKKLSKNLEFNTLIIEPTHNYTTSTIKLFPNVHILDENTPWILNEDKIYLSKQINLPYELLSLLKNIKKEKLITLTEMGINYGQGFRSGANEFFYLNKIEENENVIIVKSNNWDEGGKNYILKKDDVISALQSRNDVEGIIIKPELLPKVIFSPRNNLDDELKKYIQSAEKYTDPKGKKFKEYSAVKPNERKEGNKIIREWFRLPQFTNRHFPNLCITRVSSGITECLYVQQSKTNQIVIDANMITLWSDDERNILIILALLNSTWSKVFFELSCTIMGGGALKIEASHLKKLYFPIFNKKEYDELMELGKNIVINESINNNIQNNIDTIIANSFGDDNLTYKMKKLLIRKYNERRTAK